MAMLDLLEAFARRNVTTASAAEARQALIQLSRRTLPSNLDTSAKRIMVGELYDTYVALMHVDMNQAIASYKRLTAAPQRDVLAGAIMTGLIDLGVPRSETAALLAELVEGPPDMLRQLHQSEHRN